MRVILLRHGRAVDASEVGGRDESRMLDKGGRRKVEGAARAFRRLGVLPDVIWTSPLQRAIETARLTAETLACPERVRPDARLKPGAAADDFLDVLVGGGQTQMVVGHNPDLEIFLAWMVAGAAAIEIPLKKGAYAVVDFPAEIAEGSGRLAGLWTSGDLNRLLNQD
jgi:phosphohistidine phosphatase